jgi:hypothetical protein
MKSDYFYNIKPLWVGNFGTVIKKKVKKNHFGNDFVSGKAFLGS